MMDKKIKAFRCLLCAALLMSALFSADKAQQKSSTPVGVSNQTIRLFHSPPSREPYPLTSGDQLSVRVFAHPELSYEATVDERGLINQPFLGELKVAGLTVERVKTELLLRLRILLSNPQVSVRLLTSPRRESVAVYAEYDQQGRETAIYTSMIGAGDLRINWRIRSLSHKEFLLSFFSRDAFSDGADSYDVKVLFDRNRSLSLGRAYKIYPTVVTAYNDPYLELRLKAGLTTLGQLAKSDDVTFKLGALEFKLRANDLEALRFIVAHCS